MHDHALDLLRELAPQVLGAVVRRHGDFAEAEDAVQEALIAAAAQWPVAGVPTNPSGWLYHVATRRLQDHRRSELARRRREDDAAISSRNSEAFAPPPDSEIGASKDDSLLLLFMCCHPSLSPSSSIALTLRAVGGLTTAEIAKAFLVPESTMAQRVSRAKASIKTSGIPLNMPDASERATRLGAVLHVLYLMFNEGYTSSIGAELSRMDLSNEAIRLTRGLHQVLPREAEVTGLLALMLLTDARRDARTGPSGELIPLDEQDRSRWRRSFIEEGLLLVEESMRTGRVGPYQLQAAIAALHDESPSHQATDWVQISALYTVLAEITDNPMVSLSKAIAVAMVEGPSAGLAQLDALESDERIRGHYRLSAVRAHLLERSGDVEGAIRHFRAAADRTTSIPERDYLLTKAARLNERTTLPRNANLPSQNT